MIDKNLELASSQAMSGVTTVVSENYIDLKKARDIANGGKPLYGELEVDDALVITGSAEPNYIGAIIVDIFLCGTPPTSGIPATSVLIGRTPQLINTAVATPDLFTLDAGSRIYCGIAPLTDDSQPYRWWTDATAVGLESIATGANTPDFGPVGYQYIGALISINGTCTAGSVSVRLTTEVTRVKEFHETGRPW